MKVQEQKLYAFWSYDQPPYLLGGEMAEIMPDGKVRIEGLGVVTPKAILPDTAGEDALEGIDQLHDNWFRDKDVLSNKLERAGMDLIGLVSEQTHTEKVNDEELRR